MYEGTLPRVSNRADWIDTLEITDAETGELIDLTGASIVIDVRRQFDRDCSPLLEATTANGKVTVVGLGQAQFAFSRSEMTSLRPDTYDIGLTVERDGITEQLIIATVAILDGIVRK